jgi:8-oxo-dGTP pyrophosphatase MutT (NUDIX family)
MSLPGPSGWQEHAQRIIGTATEADRASFVGLRRFCLFVGQSRSGHSVVGTLLNAHRHAVIAHGIDVLDFLRAGVGREDLLLLLLARDRWLGERSRRIGGYSYDIPGLWLGHHDAMEIIGDKRAGATSRHLAEDPGLLRRLAEELGLPLLLIHHVRNPWDNISSIWSRKTLGTERSLPETIEHYFEMVEGAIAGIDALPPGSGWTRTYHEALIADPRGVLRGLCDLLGLEADDAYLDACAGFVHTSPRRTRFDAPWTPALIDEVTERARGFDFLAGYGFNDE